MERIKVRLEVVDERFAGVNGDEWMERRFITASSSVYPLKVDINGAAHPR